MNGAAGHIDDRVGFDDSVTLRNTFKAAADREFFLHAALDRGQIGTDIGERRPQAHIYLDLLAAQETITLQGRIFELVAQFHLDHVARHRQLDVVARHVHHAVFMQRDAVGVVAWQCIVRINCNLCF